MLIINCTVPTNVKKYVSIHFTFYPMPEISLLCFLLPSQSTTNGFHVTLPTSPYFTLMSFSRAFSQHAEILLAGTCHQFGSNEFIKINYRVGHFLYQQHKYFYVEEISPFLKNVIPYFLVEI